MRLIFCLLGFVFFSCSPMENENERDDFDELVEMHCRARKLKNERFSLAEEMRQNPRQEVNYDSLRRVKSEVSRALSDSIRLKLEQLTSNLSLEEKRVFNEKVESRIQKMDCD